MWCGSGGVRAAVSTPDRGDAPVPADTVVAHL